MKKVTLLLDGLKFEIRDVFTSRDTDEVRHNCQLNTLLCVV